MSDRKDSWDSGLKACVTFFIGSKSLFFKLLEAVGSSKWCRIVQTKISKVNKELKSKKVTQSKVLGPECYH